MHLSGKPTSKLVFPIRMVVDYDLDRLDVEVPQGMELTSTNNPIDLFTNISFQSLIDFLIRVLDS